MKKGSSHVGQKRHCRIMMNLAAATIWNSFCEELAFKKLPVIHIAQNFFQHVAQQVIQQTSHPKDVTFNFFSGILHSRLSNKPTIQRM